MEAMRSKVDQGKDFMVINAFCGSGKTLTFMDMCNDLYRRGTIEKVLVLTPRLNLCRQYEQDWNEWRGKFAGDVLGQVIAKGNNPPLIEQNFDRQDGVAVTYSSLNRQPDLYRDFCRRYRVGLIADEAQILGSEGENYEDSTRAANLVAELKDLAEFTFIGTGTATRSDGKEIVGATYAKQPNADGVYPLLADVEATYLEGVQYGYLRKLEAELLDGRALREFFDDKQPENLIVSETRKRLSQILKFPGFWKDFVDRAVAKLMAIWAQGKPCKRYKLLIGACDQDHARQILKYLQTRHSRLRSHLAISDEPDSNKVLQDFRRPEYGDVLVSVGMAYVGYSQPYITVVCNLGGFRFEGWLDQFNFRGGRMIVNDEEIMAYEQCLWIIGPDDPRFRTWVERRRMDAENGLRERRGSVERTPPSRQESLSVITDAATTHVLGVGMDPTRDINDPQIFHAIDTLIATYNMGAVRPTGLYELLTAQGIDPIVAAASFPKKAADEPEMFAGSNLTHEEKKTVVRRQIKEVCNAIDRTVMAYDPSAKHGWAHGKLKEQFEVGTPEADFKTLVAMWNYASETLKPQVEAWAKNKSA